MDSYSSGNYAVECIYTAFDMWGASSINFSFWMKEVSDESHECPTSGAISTMRDCTAYTCDGTTWYKLTDLAPAPTSYTKYSETSVGSNCNEINSSFSIALCHYDDGAYSTDGFFYDDINIKR